MTCLRRLSDNEHSDVLVCDEMNCEYRRVPIEVNSNFDGYPSPDDCLQDMYLCHCGEKVIYGFDGDPNHTRGMCELCDAVRCDAFPGDCGRANRQRVQAL